MGKIADMALKLLTSLSKQKLSAFNLLARQSQCTSDVLASSSNNNSSSTAAPATANNTASSIVRSITTSSSGTVSAPLNNNNNNNNLTSSSALLSTSAAAAAAAAGDKRKRKGPESPATAASDEQVFVNAAGEVVRLPQRTKNAFTYFMQRQANERHPDSAFSLKDIGEHWRRLSLKDRRQYIELEQQDRQRYSEDMRQFRQLDTALQRQLLDQQRCRQLRRQRLRHERLLSTQRRQMDRPRRPLAAFISYLMKRLAETQTGGDAASLDKTSRAAFYRRVGEEWRNLPDDQKTPYRETAASAMAKYHTALTEWEQRMLEQGRPELLRVSSLSLSDRSSPDKRLESAKRPARRQRVSKKRGQTDDTTDSE